MHAGLATQPMEYTPIPVEALCTSLPFLLARRVCARISLSTLQLINGEDPHEHKLPRFLLYYKLVIHLKSSGAQYPESPDS